MTNALLRVASYNIHKAIGTDRLRRPERILSVLTEIDADVVALQEADRRLGARLAAVTRDQVEQTTPYRVVDLAVRPGSIGWHGNALLVRRDIEVARAERLQLPTIEPRGSVVAELRIGTVQVRIVGMHLDLSGLHRRRQARAILAHLAELPPRPTVLMGDTNEWRARGGCLIDFAEQFDAADTGPSFHSRRPIARLDRIMVDHALKVCQHAVHRSPLARRASDHLPIWADISVKI